MRFADYLQHSLASLRKKKLRTFLTTFGVVIGIGALVSMMSFGLGIERNVTDQFKRMELFNYVMAFSGDSPFGGFLPGASSPVDKVALDGPMLEKIRALKGAEAVFPDARFPAQSRFRDKEEFGFVQIIPVDASTRGLIQLRAGDFFSSADADAVIVSDTFLRGAGVKDFDSAIGQNLTISSLYFDLERLKSLDFSSGLPIGRAEYSFRISGVSSRMGFGGALPIRSEIFVPEGTAASMKKLILTSLWDLFRGAGSQSYGMVNIRASSPQAVESLKSQLHDMGLQTFALMDQLEEIKTGFLFLDMILAALGMIAIVVAALGIINTMVMSILERYTEIGVMKAVGATNGDVQKIFFFESGAMGFMGGLFGFGLGWLVSQVINLLVNSFLSGQGVPQIHYFSFPWWLFLGAVFFAVLVSLAAGLYPASRAARVDPVLALRHN